MVGIPRRIVRGHEYREKNAARTLLFFLHKSHNLRILGCITNAINTQVLDKVHCNAIVSLNGERMATADSKTADTAPPVLCEREKNLSVRTDGQTMTLC